MAATATISDQLTQIGRYLDSIESTLVPTWGTLPATQQCLITSRLKSAVQILYAEGLPGPIGDAFLNVLVPRCHNNLKQIVDNVDGSSEGAAYDKESLTKVVEAIKNCLPHIVVREKKATTPQKRLEGLSTLTGNEWIMPYGTGQPITVGLGVAQDLLGECPEVGADEFLRLENATCSISENTVTIKSTFLSPFLPTELSTLIGSYLAPQGTWYISNYSFYTNLSRTLHRYPLQVMNEDELETTVVAMAEELQKQEGTLLGMGHNEFGIT